MTRSLTIARSPKSQRLILFPLIALLISLTAIVSTTRLTVFDRLFAGSPAAAPISRPASESSVEAVSEAMDDLPGSSGGGAEQRVILIGGSNRGVDNLSGPTSCVERCIIVLILIGGSVGGMDNLPGPAGVVERCV